MSRGRGRTRREVIAAAGAAALTGAAGAARAEDGDGLGGMPYRDRFQSFRQTFRIDPDPEEAERILRNLVRGRPGEEGLVELDAPEIAENGNVVPIAFRVNCSMRGGDIPRAVHVLAMGNPFPEVAKYFFTELSGRAEVAMRCRMRQTAELVALADMADGRLGLARRLVHVTLGACS